MLIILIQLYPDVLCKLFTKILYDNKFPRAWITGMLLPLHKKRPKSCVGNYRGIMLLSCLGKLFSAIINERLLNFLHQNNILAKEQGKKLYACFIDFEKAFDSLPRHLLLEKLKTCGVRGDMLKTIQSMYQEDKACIKLCDKLTETFSINTGVKQGDNPTSFNLSKRHQNSFGFEYFKLNLSTILFV